MLLRFNSKQPTGLPSIVPVFNCISSKSPYPFFFRSISTELLIRRKRRVSWHEAIRCERCNFLAGFHIIFIARLLRFYRIQVRKCRKRSRATFPTVKIWKRDASRRQEETRDYSFQQRVFLSSYQHREIPILVATGSIVFLEKGYTSNAVTCRRLAFPRIRGSIKRNARTNWRIDGFANCSHVYHFFLPLNTIEHGTPV